MGSVVASPALDQSLGPDVRVRLWERAPSGPEAAPLGGHAELELSCVLGGRVGYRIGRCETWAEAGDAFVVPSAASHVTMFDGKLTAVALWLGRDFLGQAGEAMGVRPSGLPGGVLRAPDGFTALARVLAREISEAAPGHHVVAEALVDALAVQLLRRGATPPTAGTAQGAPTHPKVRRALDRIHAEYAEPLTAAELRARSGCRASRSADSFASRSASRPTGTCSRRASTAPPSSFGADGAR